VRVKQFATFVCLAGIGTALCGCLGQKPLLQAGDATSAEIMYSGDIDDARSLARQHCAEYNRVPRLVETAPQMAYFACDPR
jgi:hypothetical protein